MRKVFDSLEEAQREILNIYYIEFSNSYWIGTLTESWPEKKEEPYFVLASVDSVTIWSSTGNYVALTNFKPCDLHNLWDNFVRKCNEEADADNPISVHSFEGNFLALLFDLEDETMDEKKKKKDKRFIWLREQLPENTVVTLVTKLSSILDPIKAV